MPIYGHTFFGHNAAILRQTVVKFFIGTRGTIIYRVVVINPSNDAYFSFLNFRATFGGKMGVATTRAPNGLGSPNPAKKLVHWVYLLGQPLSRNHVFEITISKSYLEIMFSKFSRVRLHPHHLNDN